MSFSLEVNGDPTQAVLFVRVLIFRYVHVPSNVVDRRSQVCTTIAVAYGITLLEQVEFAIEARALPFMSISSDVSAFARLALSIGA